MVVVLVLRRLVPRRIWRSNQVGSGAVDSRPVATLKRENTGIRRHRWVRSRRLANDGLRWRRAILRVWVDELSCYDISSQFGTLLAAHCQSQVRYACLEGFLRPLELPDATIPWSKHHLDSGERSAIVVFFCLSQIMSPDRWSQLVRRSASPIPHTR